MGKITVIKKTREQLLSEIRNRSESGRHRLEKKGGDAITERELIALCRGLHINMEYSPEMEEMEAAFKKLKAWHSHVDFIDHENAKIGEAHVADWVSIFGEEDTERLEYDQSLKPTAYEFELAVEYARFLGV